MRHEENFHAGFEQGADNLPGNLGTFPVVGRGYGFVEQQQRIWRQFGGDVAHARQFLIKLAARHGGVLLAFVMREQAAANICGKRFGGHEQAALHHQLRQPHAAQKVDLPPWFAPVTMTRRLPSAATSLPTILFSVLRTRQASRRPAQ